MNFKRIKFHSGGGSGGGGGCSKSSSLQKDAS